MVIQNIDVLRYQDLFCEAPCPAFFANTRVGRVVDSVFDKAWSRFRFYSLKNAMQADATIDVLNLHIPNAIDHSKRAYLLDEQLGRHLTNDVALRFMRDLYWKPGPKGYLPIPAQTALKSVKPFFTRELLSGRHMWSPFHRPEPLVEIPEKWDVPTFVRMLMCGQFDDLKHYCSDQEAVEPITRSTTEIRGKSGMEVAFRMTYHFGFTWVFRWDGDRLVAEGFDSGVVDRIIVTPTLY